ncbi:lipid-binding SYLF domain-containing protein [Acetobacter sp. TBRC 12305]|uniref:Lipid-binding SYLF domain-containing protein n=1 Tax=Acetobacter garciniae TaxID=2817435 RepID=A0A939KQU6_9PROT|nr:lipid-binding SYLF domain-containing protein [Acetobacter garciniae]MBO1324161.1 lipid-binding SYLF domain-containing protein [Acetobacter garciniae]MBX0343850.1 lipid-binding SYLF domain-containing protein [Acetobacter garciniae]
MHSILRLSAVSALVVTAALSAEAPVCAYAADSAQSIVDKATLSVEDIFSTSSQQSNLTGNLSSARAVMVCPSMFRVSIGFGGSHGDCVLLARDARGSWSDPAFYKLSSASMGIQFGVQSSQIIFFVMTDRGLQALLDSQFQFDSNAGASFANMSSATASGTAGARNTDILIAQKSQGVFAGVSLGGSKLTVNSDVNRDYYKQSVGPEDIVVSMRVNNPDADPLRRVLMRYAKAAPATTQQSVPRYAPQTTPHTAYPGDATGDGVGATAPSGGIQQENLGPVSR